MNPRLEQVAEEGGGMFAEEVCKTEREGNIPERCLSAASSNAALGPLWSLDCPPLPVSSLHIV